MAFGPFKPCGFFNFYTVDKSICHLSHIWSVNVHFQLILIFVSCKKRVLTLFIAASNLNLD